MEIGWHRPYSGHLNPAGGTVGQKGLVSAGLAKPISHPFLPKVCVPTIISAVDVSDNQCKWRANRELVKHFNGAGEN